MTNQRLRREWSAAVAIAAATVLITGALPFSPLHANGASGSALMPHYNKYFTLARFGPLPDNPGLGELRRSLGRTLRSGAIRGNTGLRTGPIPPGDQRPQES